MKKLQTTLQAFVLAAVLTIGASYAIAWTGPTAVAPGNNVAAPINVSDQAQFKAGSLQLGSANPAVSFRTVAGKAAFGTVNAISPYLDVLIGGDSTNGGVIGAKAYCDQQGANCITPLIPDGITEQSDNDSAFTVTQKLGALGSWNSDTSSQRTFIYRTISIPNKRFCSLSMSHANLSDSKGLVGARCQVYSVGVPVNGVYNWMVKSIIFPKAEDASGNRITNGISGSNACSATCIN